MSTNHKHHHCAHATVKFCQHCDACYCTSCGKEWGNQSYQWTWAGGTNTTKWPHDDWKKILGSDTIKLCAHTEKVDTSGTTN